jgi:hypothetical protein
MESCRSVFLGILYSVMTRRLPVRCGKWRSGAETPGRCALRFTDLGTRRQVGRPPSAIKEGPGEWSPTWLATYFGVIRLVQGSIFPILTGPTEIPTPGARINQKRSRN